VNEGEAPDSYYCRDGDSLPKSAITTMLKYLSKNDEK
jgi:hypothetical protein